MRKFLVMISLLILITGSLVTNETEMKTIPDFTLTDIDGNEVNLYSLLDSGTYVIIDFWATWCVPCCKALPHLNKFHEDYEKVVVLAISEDSKRMTKKATQYIKDQNYTFTTLLDPKGEVKKLLGVNVLPETFYVKPDKSVFWRHFGYKNGEEIVMKEELDKMLQSGQINAPDVQEQVGKYEKNVTSDTNRLYSFCRM